MNKLSLFLMAAHLKDTDQVTVHLEHLEVLRSLQQLLDDNDEVLGQDHTP